LLKGILNDPLRNAVRFIRKAMIKRSMFEFTIYVAIMLIGCMTATHYYFAGKIKENIKRVREEWSRDTAKFIVDNFKKLTESPSYNKLEEFYYSMYMKQFETAKMIITAEKPQRWLDDSLKCFTLAIIFFFVTGVSACTSFPEYYFLPTFIAGVMAVVYAVIQIYRISKALSPALIP
jgi:hypothetical protein